MRCFLVSILLLASSGCHSYTTSSLVAAAREGDAAQIRTLLANGESPEGFFGVNGWTPLMHAIHKNQAASVEALLAGGANPNQASESGGQTPLGMAAGYGQSDIVRLLLAHGADPRLRDRKGNTPLDLALTGTADVDRFTLGQCQSEVVKILRKAAPDVRPQGSLLQRLSGC